MSHQDMTAARERIATAVLAAMVSSKEEWCASEDGNALAEIACDYADALLIKLERYEFDGETKRKGVST